MSERNLKPTILDLLRVNHLLSTKDILDKLQTQGKHYNKTSAYRALDQLVAANTICKQYFTDGQALYELKEEHHVHTVCNNCGQVEVAECDYLQPAHVGDFQVDHHHLTLMGLCKNCQKLVS